jgi:hypothetical protein
MAERDTQKKCVENQLRGGSFQARTGGRNGDGSSDSRVIETINKLCEDIVHSQEKRRENIEARYPNVFRSGTNIDDPKQSVGTVYWEFGYGWDTLIENLAAAIDREIERDPSLAQGDTPFQILRMKEKFGTLRFYYAGGNDRIRGLVDMTEKLSGSVCEICGSLGTMCKHKNGTWIKTLCEDCATRMEYEILPEQDGG